MEPDKSKKLLPEENEIKNKQEEEIPKNILAAEDYYKGIILVAQNYTCDILEDTRYYLKKLNIKEARELAFELYPTEKKLLYKLNENNLDCCECTFTKKPKTDEDLISQITLHTRAIKALSRKLFSINHDQLFNYYKYHTYRKPIVPDVQIMCADIIYTLANMSYHQSAIKILHNLRNNPHFIRASTGGNEKPNTHKNEHEAYLFSHYKPITFI